MKVSTHSSPFVIWRRYCLLLLGICVAFAMQAQKIPERPNPPRLVNDFANLLTPDQRQFLENQLVAYDDSTSVQIAVVIVASLDDYEPADYALKLGRDWGVGNKKTNNGVVFLISTAPGNRKVFIAPGYGLEGAIPDITAKQIIENNIIPLFKQDNYFGGIKAGTDAIIAASRGEYKAPAGYADRGKGKGGSSPLIFLVILVVVIFILGGSSRGGGPKGGMFSRRGYRGLLGPMIFFPGGGGGSSGGFGGGGGGGGGFGGFGGGSFGGGGAGGSW